MSPFYALAETEVHIVVGCFMGSHIVVGCCMGSHKALCG